MFEQASRLKLRFNFRGLLTVEDLWDLSATALDTIYKGLAKEVKKEAEESLLTTRTAADAVLDLQIQIVKHIFTVKQAERVALLEKKTNADKRQKLMGIIESKQEQSLHEMTIDELTAMLNQTEG